MFDKYPAAIALMLLIAVAQASEPVSHVDNTTIRGKVLAGYQAWFRCPGDGSPLNTWSHWWNDVPAPAHPDVDGFPDIREYPRVSTCALPGVTIHGHQAYVFSNYPKETEELHFAWMRQYGIDGVVLQRWPSRIPSYKQEHDAILTNSIAAAVDNGRVLFIEYDVSGLTPERALALIQEDVRYLDKKKVFDRTAYLHEAGKPIISVWGLGFYDGGRGDHITSPTGALSIIRWLKKKNFTVMGGVPTGWRTLSWDSVRDPAWKAVYASLDIIQPWSVDRYNNEAGIEHFRTDRLIPDAVTAHANHQIYMPVVFPGYSRFNRHGQPPLNSTPRNGGRFLWQQAANAKEAGADAVKIAMFDEFNEGTAIFKAAATKRDTPDHFSFVTMDIDGDPLPSDWYLHVSCLIGKVFHGQIENQPTLPNMPCGVKP